MSEVFDNNVVSKFYNSLSTSLCARTCLYEIDKFKKDVNPDISAIKQLEKSYAAFSTNLESECMYLEKVLNYKVVPIQSLVRIQLESGLIVAERRQKGDKNE